MTTPRKADPITEPGIYDLTDEQYHADPVVGGSLSSGGARTLLEPGGGAKYAYRRGRTINSTTFDLGKAAHTMTLGAGAGIVEVHADSWRPNAAKDAKEQAYAAGKIPVLSHDYRRVVAMTEAIKAHPIAGGLLTSGQAEQSMFWIDKPTGVWCRSRPDWVTRDRHGRLILVDLKTCEKADEDSIARSVVAYGYDQQAAWYCTGAIYLGLAEDDMDMGFLLGFVEKQPPHLVHVAQLDADAMLRGRRRNRIALELYAEYSAEGRWPGYANDITEISLPAWATREDAF